METKIEKELKLLEKEKKQNEKSIEYYKKKTINQLKSIDKSEIINSTPKKVKINFLKKLLKIFYGKKD